MNDKPTFIYALCEPWYAPVEGEVPPAEVVRYVGISVNPVQRLRQHCCPAYRNKYCVARWVGDLRDAHQKPTLHVLGSCLLADGIETEVHWIAWYKERGADLLNLTTGGNGVFAPTPDIVAKRAATLRKTLSSSEIRSRYADLARGKKKSEAHAAAIRAAWQRPDVRAKHSDARRKSMADPRRAAPSLAALDRNRTNPEVQAKRVASLKATNARKRAERVERDGQGELPI